MRIDTVDKVNTAVKATSSYIYGTSTLLGQEGCVDYLLAVLEYVKERINKEKEGWTPEEQNRTRRSFQDYREEIDRRCEVLRQAELSRPPLTVVSNEEEDIRWRNELYREAEQLHGTDAASIIRAANAARKKNSLLAVYPSLNDPTG